MTEAIQKNYDQLLDEAASWIARLRAPKASAQQHADFSKWLNSSPAHTQAFDEMSDTWETLGAAAHISELTDSMQPKSAKATETSRSGWSWLSWQGGFALACVAGLFAIVTMLAPSNIIPPETYITAAGEQRSVTLKDGSTISLNTRTELQVSYTDLQRNLTLVSGEAYFEVASDKQRPFIVDVGQGTVMAVGTAFNIHRESQTAQVVVTEGIVQMREHQDATTPAPKSERLTVDQQARFGQRGLSNVSHADIQSFLAWREQTLIFDQVSLPLALKELNRYLSTPIDYSHDSLKDLEVSGTFSVKAPEATLQALKASFNLAELTDKPQSLYAPAE
ncbi:MAG: FecR family protein [Cellvibrionaceae bacterium]